jgi:hypothetical protein
MSTTTQPTQPTQPTTQTLTRDQLVSSLVQSTGLSQPDADKAVSHVVSELVFANGGKLAADQNCNACGGSLMKSAQ